MNSAGSSTSESSSSEIIEFSTLEGSSSEMTESSSSLTSPQPPPPPPVIPFACDDFGHCGAIGDPTVPQRCDIATATMCPGFPGARTPLAMNGRIHPAPTFALVCDHCRPHDGPPYAPNKILYLQRQANANPYSGHHNQLCNRCILEEVELYWLRQNTAVPTGPLGGGPLGTLAQVEQWPTTAHSLQDLCICRQNAIQPYSTRHCHACRNHAFDIHSDQHYTHAERILSTRTKPVITGTKRCIINGGTAQHMVRPTAVASRFTQGIGRMCPCGNKPKLPSTPEYITMCLGCSGVRIDPANLPPKYAQARILQSLNRRRTLRGSPLARTRGPRHTDRSHLFRVNIECGWIVPQDPWVRGT